MGDADGITFGNGFVFVADSGAGIRKIQVSNGANSVFGAGIAVNATGSPLACRASDGHVFVGLGGLTGILRIDEYDANGTLLKGHVTGTDAETMTFDPASGLIYYAAFGSSVRELNPITDGDRLVGTVDGTIDGALAFDPLTQLLFVGTANGNNPGQVDTINVKTGTVSPFASGFSSATGIIREPVSGNLYFLEDGALYMLGKTNVNQSIPPVAIGVTFSANVAGTSWQVVAGNSYQLQFTSRLGVDAWTNLGSAKTSISNRLDFTDSAATNIQRFYRLAVVP